MILPMNEIAARFGQVFWGLLLVILDVSINHFDLLPDFIGYILVAVGLGGLTGLSLQFVRAYVCAWVLVPIAVIGLLPLSRFTVVVELVHVGFHCVMMWSLLGGIMDYATAQARLDLAQRASTRRVVYIALMCVVALLGLVAEAVGRPVPLLVVVTGICLLALVILILHLIHRVRVELAT